ncbi:DNA methyltransferase [Alicyclobacillus fastidiosus]|uniref:DNA methyltransferase n=1 Tax=Alicyclobacillus fastidiosus TaxID=392011 RepID=A0ABY6ZIZ9_9BACL|nr:DNA methyltransferase [Alicyclobacillus fastidiosus]WAH42811.1 DNA methyltransferase [Alicyclobacillus fastidiosus]GMA64734.1 hypothetical protein GCM10025859_51740 [Alicyclobacillus fastidiosus]
MSATNRANHKRNANDSYPTPSWCTEAIVREIVWTSDSRVLEPCCGDGAISRVIEHVQWVSHIEWCEIQMGRDFLEYDFFGERFDFVITNPPFSLAQEFVEKSLTLANCVIMLLRLNFLASGKRKEFWEKHPPTAIHVLTKRPSFTGNGTDATDYAWFVWDTTGRQKHGMFWI